MSTHIKTAPAAMVRAFNQKQQPIYDMKRKALQLIAWLLVILLGIGVVTDDICGLGLNRGWQYLYNGFYFVAALPGLLAVIISENNQPHKNHYRI